MRRILIILGVLAVVVVLIVLIAPSLIRVDRYRPQIEARLKEKLGRDVKLGALKLRVIPLAVSSDSIMIGESAQFTSSRPFATANDVKADVQLFSLLSGKPVFDSLSMSRPSIELIRDAKGVWNFSTLGARSQEDTKSSFTLKKLNIDDGQVGVTDYSILKPRTVYDHIDVDLRDFGSKNKSHVKLAAHLPGQGDQLVALDADVGPAPNGYTATTPIDGRLSMKRVSLSGFSRFINGVLPPDTDAVASGDADVKTDNFVVSYKGNLRLENTRIRGNQLGYPIEAKYDVRVDRKQNLIQIRSGDLKLDATPVSIKGQIDAGKTPNIVDVRLITQNAAITEVARLAGAFGVGFNPKYQFKGNITVDVTAQGAMNAPQLAGKVSANRVEVSGGDIKQPVSVPQITLVLAPDAIRSNTFTAQSGATRVEGMFALSQYSSKNGNVDATLKTDGANIAELLNIAKAYGVNAAKGVDGSGRLSLNVHVQGPMSEADKLVYNGAGEITGATLSTPSLTKPVVIRKADIHFAQNAVSFNNLDASLASTTLHGNLSANNFAAPNLQFDLSADKINTNELQQLHAKTPPAGGKGAASSASPLEKASGSGNIAVNTIVASDIVLNNVRSGVKLNRGVIELSPLTADVYGGKGNGAIVLDIRPATPTCSVRVKLSGVDANRALSATSSVKNTLDGALSADTNLSFPLASGSNLTRGLNGTASFNVVNGRLRNVNILNEIGKVGKFLGVPGQSGSDTSLKKLAGTLTVHNGLASTDNLVAVLNEGSLSGSGLINLVDQGINMRVNVVLASAVSNIVGGTKIGGFLNTALANNRGELVVPVHVTGSLAKPIFTPDTQALAQMKLKSLLPTANDPGKLSTGIMGALSGKGAANTVRDILGGGQPQSGQPQSGQAQKPRPSTGEEAVQSIFDALGGKKKKK
jgi:AsmA protein